jgi:KUP system potassium uptake protein
MLAILGISNYSKYRSIKSCKPVLCAYHLLSIHPEGFVLGFVSLCTTGVEALYSDIQCGRKKYQN